MFPSALWHQTVLHSTLVGMFANGPLLHFFFEFMDKFITVQSRFWNIVIKVVIDQVIRHPTYSTRSALERGFE